MKKGFVLIIVSGALLVMSTLALAAIYSWTQHYRIREWKINRIRAFYAGQAAVVYYFNRLRCDVYGGAGEPYGSWFATPFTLGALIPGYPVAGIRPRVRITQNAGPTNKPPLPRETEISVRVQYFDPGPGPDFLP